MRTRLDISKKSLVCLAGAVGCTWLWGAGAWSQVGDQAKGAGDATASLVAAKEADDEALDVVWDSYGAPQESVAQEVTKGIRVEDIVEPPAEYRYAAFGKGDPFVPPMATSDPAAAGGKVDALEVPIISPLQRYSLEELAIVGIWQVSSGARKALVMAKADTSSQGIIVQEGDPIGNRGGKILSIADKYLTVREFTLSTDGARQYEDHVMHIGSQERADKPGTLRFEPGGKVEVLIDGKSTADLPAAAVIPEPQAASQVPGAPLPAANAAPPAPQNAAAPATALPAMAAPAGGGVGEAALTMPTAPASDISALIPTAEGYGAASMLPDSSSVPGQVPPAPAALSPGAGNGSSMNGLNFPQGMTPP